jgi:hypothetical protein
MHRFDWYAKPVSLTYNQRKSFATVPGAICTFISGSLLIFYIASNLVKFFDPDYVVYFSSQSNTLVNFASPPTFNL